MWKLWRHSCPTQVPGIRYNVLQVPQKESLAPGMPLGQQRHNQHRRRTGSACQTASTKPTKRHGWSPCRPGHRRQAIHTVTDDSDDDVASGLECLEFSSIEKNSGDNRDELYASLDIQYKRPASLRVKVDTGAQENILPLRIFRRMFPEKLAPNGYPAEGTTKKR